MLRNRRALPSGFTSGRNALRARPKNLANSATDPEHTHAQWPARLLRLAVVSIYQLGKITPNADHHARERLVTLDRRNLVVLAAFVLVVSGAFAQKVKVDDDKSVGSSRYKTYTVQRPSNGPA